MLFDGEEFTMGARLFTWGYDLYSPGTNAISHIYMREEAGTTKYWDFDWAKRFYIQKVAPPHQHHSNHHQMHRSW